MSSTIIRNILVPVDFSETSLNALETALTIARRHQSTVQILHVIDNTFDFTLAGDGYNTSSNFLDNSSDILQALAGSIYQKHQIMPAVISEEGHVSNCIVKNAITQKADLMVMGTHGASGIREGFIGSNAYGVIKHASCPVLTIPPKKKWGDFKRVLFPVKPISSALSRYEFVRELIARTNCSLEVLGLSCSRSGNDAEVIAEMIDEFKDTLAADKVHVSTKYNYGKNVADDVLKTAAGLKADLIVLTPLVDVTNKHFFVGPNTQRIVNYARVPVLSVRRITTPSVTGMASKSISF